MIEFFLQTQNKYVYAPSHLGECDERQFVESCQLIFLYQTGQINLDEFLLQMLYKQFNLKARPSTDPDKYADLLDKAQVFTSFFSETDDKLSIRLEFAHTPIKYVSPGIVKLYGPADGFADATFGEYTDALRLFHQFRHTPDVQILADLASILYRPRYLFTDKRKNYDASRAFKRSDDLKQLNIGFLYGIYLTFASFQNYLTTAQIPWGGNLLDLSILFDSQEKPTIEAEPGIGMDAILFTMAESGAFGSLKETQQTELWTVLIRLYDLRKRELEQKRQLKTETK